MTISERLQQDIKTAMLAGDKTLTTTLRGLKSAILYEEVAKGSREEGLSDPEIVTLFSKEAKKRQDSAEMYTQGGSPERADAELHEKKVIEQYLPQQLSDQELESMVNEAIEALGGLTQQTMGQVIGKIKADSKGAVDGGRIAAAVKQKLQA